MLNSSTAQITIFETYRCVIRDYDEDGDSTEEVSSDDPEQAYIETLRKAYSRVGFSLDSTYIYKLKIYRLEEKVLLEEVISSFSSQELGALETRFKDEINILAKQRIELTKANKNCKKWKIISKKNMLNYRRRKQKRWTKSSKSMVKDR